MTKNDKAMELARQINDLSWSLPRPEDIADLIRPHLKPEWQAIETAPKDGTYMLVSLRDIIHIGFYAANAPIPGWRASAGMSFCAMNDSPTHWQPLPEPPKGDQQ